MWNRLRTASHSFRSEEDPSKPGTRFFHHLRRDDCPSKLGVLSKDTLACVLRETKPRPKPHRPTCHAQTHARAIAVSSLPATHTSSVPSIPQALTLILALTFDKTPTPSRRNCGNPRVQAKAGGELILQCPAAVDTRATVRAAGHASTVYWPVSPV